MSFLGIPTSRQDLGNSGLISGTAANLAQWGHNVNQAVGSSDNLANLSSAIRDPNIHYTGSIVNPLSEFNGTPSFHTGSQAVTVNTGPGNMPTGQTTTSAQTDPYAQYGGTAAYNNLVSGFTNQRNTLNSSLTGAEQQAGKDYNQGILSLLDQLRSAQTGIDRQSVQNELAKKQGTQSILDMVGRGIQSGGVQLANRNAGTSSASEALARAYGDIGRRELSGVGNQYAQGQNAIAQSQEDLANQQASGLQTLGYNKDKLVSNLVQTAQQQLAALDAAMASASLPDRINIEQEKERVRSDTLGQLAQFDQQLQTGVQGITPINQDQARLQAQQLATAGVAPESAFNFTSEVPAQFQGTGPFASDFPVFTAPGSRKQTA